MIRKTVGKLVESGQIHNMKHVKVLVLGAGAAGLGAASMLLSQGVNEFLLLEGSDHIGGRVHDVEFGGVRLEKGANWLQPIKGPMMKIAEKAGLEYEGVSYSEAKIVVRNKSGHIIPQYEVEEAINELCDIMSEAGDFALHCPNTDLTMKDFIMNGNWCKNSDILRKIIEWYVFDFEYTVPPEQASVDAGHWNRIGSSGFVADQRGFKIIFGDVVSHLVQKKRLLLNKKVLTIDQSSVDKIHVTCDDGSVFQADAVLLTFSLGVLQSRLVAFNPPLPNWKTAAIDHHPMGAFTKIFLKFPHKFWDDREWILHMSERKGYYPAFLNLEASGMFPQGINILMGFVVGTEAQRVENQPLDTTREEIVSVLSGMYAAQSVPYPTEIMLSGWLNDPLQMGAYSTPAVGKVIHQLQTRVGRIYFGGEATDEKFSGFVIGGIRSGEREAKKIMRQVFKREIKRKGSFGED